MAVNISAHQIKERDLCDQIMATIARTGVPSGSVHLEITESATMDRIGNAWATLGALRSRGVRISIDDFGTGYSSLSYLSRLPIDVIKIDRSFVNRLLGDPDDTSIVEAIVAMASGSTSSPKASKPSSSSPCCASSGAVAVKAFCGADR